MAKHERASEPPPGEGSSRHKGTQQHGWSPDVGDTGQQDNDSARRSFHPDEYAAKRGPGRTVSKEESEAVSGDTVRSRSRRGEERGGKSGGKGMHDTGPRGRSQRPSGSKDASASTGIDPQDPPSDSR
ncbi:hypothetical protein [Streptomyces sp. NPDC055287]